MHWRAVSRPFLVSLNGQTMKSKIRNVVVVLFILAGAFLAAGRHPFGPSDEKWADILRREAYARGYQAGLTRGGKINRFPSAELEAARYSKAPVAEDSPRGEALRAEFIRGYNEAGEAKAANAAAK